MELLREVDEARGLPAFASAASRVDRRLRTGHGQRTSCSSAACCGWPPSASVRSPLQGTASETLPTKVGRARFARSSRDGDIGR